jgi:two-component system, sensor histidine kinase RegB
VEYCDRERAVDRVDPAAEPVDHRARISLEWLVLLRWGAVVGQATTIVAAEVMFGNLPLGRLFAYVGALAATNLALGLIKARTASPRLLCGAVLTLDTLLLSGLLHAVGGAYNPFSILYLVHITLAAVVLGRRWTWFLAALSVACYGLLFAANPPAAAHGATDMRIHLQGMWVAFVVAAGLTAYFVVQLSSAIERRDAEITEMRASVARHERLASVTTMAAGAAHELGTPLATIAVVSQELERTVATLPPSEQSRLAEDVRLIRTELARCRAILNRLSADAGQPRGEAPVELRVDDVVGDVLETVPAAQRGRIRVITELSGAPLRLPRAALLQVTQNLVQNALEAGDGGVDFRFATSASGVQIVVSDRGVGMSRDVLRRVGEPFFSTKPPGTGLGLGVFIARTLSEQMGGRFRLESEPGRGTTATVEIECSAPEPGMGNAG